MAKVINLKDINFLFIIHKFIEKMKRVEKIIQSMFIFQDNRLCKMLLEIIELKKQRNILKYMQFNIDETFEFNLFIEIRYFEN